MSTSTASTSQQRNQRPGFVWRRGLATVATGLAITAVLIAATGGAGGRGKADVESASDSAVLERIEGEPVAASDAFIKIGDINGESSSVNAAASSDVVIKGKKILQNAPVSPVGDLAANEPTMNPMKIDGFLKVPDIPGPASR